MTDAKLNYVGPIPQALTYQPPPTPWWKRVPFGFIAIVVVPTTLAAVYLLGVASPRYVSEARFIVRSATQSQPSSLGVALQGVGISTTQSDAFAVHEFINSRDGLDELKTKFDVATVFGRPGVDAFSRYPRPGEDRTDEGLYKAFQRFVTVGYDSTTGISTLRVEAFRPVDARALNDAMLSAGESLINRLNERAAGDAVEAATRAQQDAQLRLSATQQSLTAFRNREKFIDPALAAQEGSELIGGLLALVAQLKAERAQLVADAPESPMLPTLESRITAYERQIEAERAKIVGTSTSLAPSISAYEDLTLQRELADRELAQATTALIAAQQESRRQKLYLDRIVNPNMPDKSIEPKRWTALLTFFVSVMLIYGVG